MPELCPLPVKGPWYHVGIYFIGLMCPPSRQGNQYNFTVSDYFTKFMEAVSLRNNVLMVLQKPSLRYIIIL